MQLAEVIASKNQNRTSTENSTTKTEVSSRLPDTVQITLGRNQVTEGIVHYSDGRKEEYYILRNALLQRLANSREIWISSITDSEAAMDSTDIVESPTPFRVGRFPGTSWLSLKNYQGIDMIDDKPCYRYAMILPGQEYFPDLNRQTWIRVEDGYPAKVQVNSLVINFSPVVKFDGDVPLPPDYLNVLRRNEEHQKAMEAMRKANAR